MCLFDPFRVGRMGTSHLEFHSLRSLHPRLYPMVAIGSSPFAIAKFAQALRVQKDMNERLDPLTLGELQAYIRANHPPLKTRFAEANEALGQDVEDEDSDDTSE